MMDTTWNLSTSIEYVKPAYQAVYKSTMITTFLNFHNNYIISPLLKFELCRHLLAAPASHFITIIFIYVFILLALYEIVLNIGVFLKFWKKPGHDVFLDLPVHCAHVYISLNVIDETDFPDFEEGSAIKSMGDLQNSPRYLKRPIVYHFEFSPEEYSDPEFGTDLKFLRSKVLDWFLNSQFYYLNKQDFNDDISLQDVLLFNKKGKLLNKEDEYLCNIEVQTGETVFAVIKV